MLIEYFDNAELSYTSRKRIRSFTFTPFNTEIQRSILLGDGAKTSIKTSIVNICKYVRIDGTRWFVVNYVYLNGGQVKLNLQRDVIGEFGLDNCFGKIERGYTDSILKYRKELSVNEILSKRSYLKPNTNNYYNYTVDNHENEIWGIMYISKPNEGQIVIPIPGITPDYTEDDFIPNGTKYVRASNRIATSELEVLIHAGNNKDYRYHITIDATVLSNGEVSCSCLSQLSNNSDLNYMECTLSFDNLEDKITDSQIMSLVSNFFIWFGENIIWGTDNSKYLKMPADVEPEDYPDYNNKIIKSDDKYYQYTIANENFPKYGSTNSNFFTIINNSNVQNIPFIIKNVNDNGVLKYVTCFFSNFESPTTGNSTLFLEYDNYININYAVFNCTEITDFDKNQIVIDLDSDDLVNEPYYILTVPLYNVKIVGNSETYNIKKDQAFNIWNSIILQLSGDNGYMVDAQIYPYCPPLKNVSTVLDGIPLFRINKTSYEYSANINLSPYSDVKKEYILNNYAIISPEQSSKFKFSYYDYFTKIEDNEGLNIATEQIKIKTALKPFSLISAAVITPGVNALIGMTYDSDLRGSMPSANGFECSLANSAFETYKRQNSNYQQIFNVEQQQLIKEHEVEKVNNTVSAIVNTASSTAFGAIAGASLTQSAFGTGAVGGTVGAAAFGGLTAAAMTMQNNANAELMAYEEQIQQIKFDLQIGTIKNLPNSVNRISTFNELILKDFWYVIETYKSSAYEYNVVLNYINNYGYSIGVFDFFINYQKDGWFLKGEIIKSSYDTNLHIIAKKELSGGIYYYEQI